MSYKLASGGAIYLPTNTFFPFADGNSDYEQYKLWLAAGNAPSPAAPIPNPAIAAIDAQLLALDMNRIRPTAEGDTAYLAILNAQAQALRVERALLPTTI